MTGPFRTWSHDWSGDRSRRAVELCRFGPALGERWGTLIVRIDEDYLWSGRPVVVFKLVRDLAPVKDNVFPDRLIVRMEQDESDGSLLFWDLWFDPVSEFGPTLHELGQVRWFLEVAGFDVRNTGWLTEREAQIHDRLVAADPVQGQLLCPEEVEAYRLLGVPAPYLWPNDQFFEWAFALPGTTVGRVGQGLP